MIKTIPLNKLIASPRNVRRSRDPQADAELKADIEAHGLLQNLVVSAAGKPRGSFAVEAGGRRLRALQQLLKEGKLPKTHDVCCLVIENKDAAQEASLAENFQRLSMNPADECLAFQQLIDLGSDVEGVARRFGLTTRFVDGRLRLAGLAPDIFEALGSGDISLDLAKAYAATPDHERQLYVFGQMSRGCGAPHADSVRRMMTQATVSAGDRRARFVGEDAYVAAGGRIERDLFADSEDARWLDVALLERLAFERLEKTAAEARAETGLGFVRPILDRWLDSSHLEGLNRVAVDTPPLSEAERAAVDALEAEADALVDLLEVEESEDQAREEAEARIRELGARLDAIVDKPPEFDPALKPLIGAFLLLDDAGQPKLDRSFYAEAGSEADSALSRSGGDRSNASDNRPAKPAGLSQRLADELAMQRRDILAVHLAVDPGLALDLLVFLMVEREARHCFEPSGSSLRASPPSDPVFDLKTPEAPATIAAAEAREALDRAWVGHSSRAARFDAFRTLPEESRRAWLGEGIARTLEASLNLPGQRFCAFHDHLGQLLGIDVARWWRPTGANYFDRVPKSVALEALTAVGGPGLSAGYAKAKKAELAEACERIFAGGVIAEAEVKHAALAWLPDVMRFADPAAEGDGAVEGVADGAARDVADDAVGDAANQVSEGGDDGDHGQDAEPVIDESEDVF